MKKIWFVFVAVGLVPTAALEAQTFPTDDPVIQEMWKEGMEEGSQAYNLAQVLMDSIGPRLTGTSGYVQAAEWLESLYNAWGVDVGRHEYGTWRGWERGITHVDLLEPRVRTLNATMMAWSPGTEGVVEAEVLALPELRSEADLEAWLPQVAGKVVAISFPEPSCRAPESWEEQATPASYQRLLQERETAERSWTQSLLLAAGMDRGGARGAEAVVARRLEDAGAVAVLRALWSDGWGADKIFDASTERVATIHLSCEDYGLVARLALNDQSPTVRIDAQAEFTGSVPAFNVVATMPGSELPDEYVLLGAHLDSWDGASGATDNGTGTIMMLEAARILKTVYPNPRRTIVIGHWDAEERGLIGSNNFQADHPEVMDGLQSAFNQDNGTWRVDYIRMMGFTDAGSHFARWFSAIPPEITQHIELDIPGLPESGGSDHMSFLCVPAPSFRFQSDYPDYRQYTWHTGIDTFDKIVFDDLRNNATLAAMVAYMASEDPERVSRETVTLPNAPLAGPMRVSRRTQNFPSIGQWPQCRVPRRSYENN
ncbi:M28 family peptidase [Gemmatimonadales bacterium]|nr:M28 family peptidase [Gemmatimonadales bacterium]